MKPHERIQTAHVRLLNTAISQLGLDKNDIKASYQVKSTKDLANAQFDELMKHFEACGFKYRPSKVNRVRPQSQRGESPKASHLRAINKALEALDKSLAYAEGIAKRMGFAAKLEWCSPEQLHKVQIALNYKVRKQAGGPVQHKPETLERRKAGNHVPDNTL